MRRRGSRPGEGRDLLAGTPLRTGPFFSPDALWLALLSSFLYFVRYLGHPAAPGNIENAWMGWFGWADQGAYLRATRALASFHLPSAGDYLYPLGYPLLGAFFFKLLPRHPYFVPDLFFAVGSVLLFYAACKTLLTRLESFLLTVFLIVFSGFAGCKGMMGRMIWENALIVPWNLIPVFFAAALNMYLMVFKKADRRAVFACSAATALAFFCRPPDALFLFLLFAAGLLDFPSWKKRAQALGVFAVACGSVLVAMTATKFHVFGAVVSPYDLRVAEIGFNPGRLLQKLYWVFIDGSPLHDYPNPMLLFVMPWLALGVSGAVLLAGRGGPKFLFPLAAVALCTAFYVSFNALSPTNVYRYHGYRYFAWAFPWMGLCAYAFLTRAWRWAGPRFVLGSLSAVLLILLSPGWREVVVGSRSLTLETAWGAPFSLRSEFDPAARRYVLALELSDPAPVEGVRLSFVKLPSHNMTVAGVWETLEVEADGRLLKLYSDYNPNQRDNAVSIAARNPWGADGKIRRLKITFNQTEEPLPGRVTLLRTSFRPFGAVRKMWAWGAPRRAWGRTEDHLYSWGHAVSFGTGGDSGAFQLRGWGPDEAGATWARGRRAGMGFVLPACGEDVLMDLVARAAPDPAGRETRTVSLWANGRRLPEWRAGPAADRSRIRIPKECLRRDGVLVVDFKFPRAFFAAPDAGAGGEWGVAFSGVTFLPVSLLGKEQR